MQVRLTQRVFDKWIREPGELMEIEEKDFHADSMEKVEPEAPLSRSAQRRLDAETASTDSSK